MFGKNIRIFKLFGFEVSIDPSWVILAVLVAWSLSTGLFPFQYRNLSPATYWLMGIVGTIGLFLSIVAHEFSHSLAAYKSGMPITGITLFIFGGVAQMEREPQSARDEFWIAVVGPISSVVIGAVFYALYGLVISIGGPQPVVGILRYLAMINGLLAVFNLLPAFPLDGGRILRSILWTVKGDLRWATRISSQIGGGFGIFLILIGVVRVLFGNFIGGMWFFLIGFFLRGMAKASYQQLLARKALEGETIRRFMHTEPVTVGPDLGIQELVDDYLLGHHFKMLPVVDANRLLGCVTLAQVKTIPRENWPQKTVSDLMQPCSPDNTVASDSDAVRVLSQLHRARNSRAMVVENGRLVGVVALKDLLEFLSLKVELDG